MGLGAVVDEPHLSTLLAADLDLEIMLSEVAERFERQIEEGHTLKLGRLLWNSA